MSSLPTFHEMTVKALECANDAADWLRSDWQPSAGPTDEQATARAEAAHHLAKAIALIEKASRG